MCIQPVSARLLLVLVLGVLMFSGTEGGGCTYSVTSKFVCSGAYKGKIYLLSKAKKVFNLDRQERLCESHGGYLFEPDDLEEVRFVTTFVKFTVRDREVFIGINDVKNEGNFIHKSTGDPVKVNIWAPGQPNGDGDCVLLHINNILYDKRCGYRNRFICEIPR